ncbi:MAG: hypothetical protein K0R83_2249, partial [Caulobacter sp.]|nr:hypothetical protein [Caulobacter sp.]
MAFAAVIDLTTLNGSNGGLAIAGVDGTMFGSAAAPAGDVNGDGYVDFVVGARGWSSDENIGTREGEAYVVFGTAGGFPANFSVADLNGHNGFVLHGEKLNGYFGWDVAGIGDINNDGFGDVLVTASIADNFQGAAYVVYGRDAAVSGDFAAACTVSDLGVTLPGSIISPSAAGQTMLGASASGIGDINHDGFADFAIGALALGGNAGGAYVIYGRAAPLPTSITEAELDGTLGFKLYADQAGGYAGRSISSAGDINGDGIDDMIVGAAQTGAGGKWSGSAYVLFGRDAASQGAFAASVSTADLDGTNGFRIDGATTNDFLGKSVAAIGDVNGDGFGDLAVTADDASDPFDGQGKGAVYIVYGRNSAVSGAFAPVISAADLTGTQGFRVQGAVAGGYAG